MKFSRRNKIDDCKDIDFTTVYINDGPNIKPNGYWYSCHDSWYNWIIREGMTIWLHKYILKININKNIMTDIRNKDKNKLLIIKTKKDLDIFNTIYGTVITKDKYKVINWKKVSKDYGGIEICPYFSSKIKDYLWYATFDAASGCIWNLKAIIRNVELIYEKKNDEYVQVSN